MTIKTRILIAFVLFFAALWFLGFDFKFLFKKDLIKSTPLPAVTKKFETFSPTISPKTSFIPETGKPLIHFNVPFTSQAPFGEWSDDRQQDGCEEASVIMAMHWVRGDVSITREEAKKEILAISDWEQEKYGNYHDTSAEDTISRIFNKYYNYKNVRLEKNATTDDIIKELEKGNLVVVPVNGIALSNPHFTSPGPERHMLVVIGYDYSKNEFISNDPGTSFGKDYRYAKNTLFNALRDYSTGSHSPIIGVNKNMIVVEK